MRLVSTRQDWRREHIRQPLRNRWLIVRARLRSTWREVWVDVLYLVRG